MGSCRVRFLELGGIGVFNLLHLGRGDGGTIVQEQLRQWSLLVVKDLLVPISNSINTPTRKMNAHAMSTCSTESTLTWI